MPIASVTQKEKNTFNRFALHPLQSWEWGEFRKKTGIEVIRLGTYRDKKLVETVQMTVHRIPFTSYTIGYIPKSNFPTKEMVEKLIEVGKHHNCIFIKLEPNIPVSKSQWSMVASPHPLFTRYTFQIDLTKTEEELLKGMHPKTRYNIKVAQKHGVTIQEDNSDAAFDIYLQLMEETTIRQKYFAHTRKYHSLMWEALKDAGIAHLLTATYAHEGKTHTLVAWILFLFNGVLYYPYGASSNFFRHTMASNLMLFEAIRFGKKHGAKLFDLWGALGPDPDPKDPWYGFHRFKLGFGPRLVEFVGSFDLVINPFVYQLYNTAHLVRNIFLTIKSYLRN